MIDVIKTTPIEYSKQSRDYQIISRLYSALFNISKMYIDNMDIWNENIDNKLATLRALTLNFDADHIWDLDDLEAVTICFKYLVRNKGTITALNTIVNILMKIENINVDIDSIKSVSLEDDYCVYIRIERELLSIGIVEDLVKYLLPAGLTYRIIEYSHLDLDDSLVTENTIENEIETSEAKISYKMFIGNGGDFISPESDITKPRKTVDTYIYGDKTMNDVIDVENNLNDSV